MGIVAEMELTEILKNAQAADTRVRSTAEQELQGFQTSDPANFLRSLAAELNNEEKPPEVRKLAGLLFKNSIDAKEPARRDELAQQWAGISQEVKHDIKTKLLQTVHSKVRTQGAYDARHWDQCPFSIA